MATTDYPYLREDEVTAEEASEAEQHPDWPKVTANDDGIRPAGKPDACFYCGRSIGNPHKADCVMVQRLVELEFSLDVPGMEKPLLLRTKQPWLFGADHINFRFNESSWCASNLASELQCSPRTQSTNSRIFKGEDDVTDEFAPFVFAAVTKRDKEGGCLCGSFEASWVRIIDNVPRTLTVPNEHIPPSPNWPLGILN